MLDVLMVVLPVFLIVGAGYGGVRIGSFSAAAIDGLMAYTIRFAIPILLFRAMVTLDLGQAFDPRLLASFYAGALGCFFATMALARFAFGRRPGESAAIGFSALFSNTVLLGLPIIDRAFGQASMAPAFSIVAVHAPVCYLVGITTMEIVRRDGASATVTARRAARAMFSNALTIGIAAGLVLNLAQVPLPEFLMAAVGLVAASGLPAALFALGGALTRYAVRDDLGEAVTAAVMSVIVHPLVVWALATQVFELPRDMTRAAVVLAAMPAGMNAYVFAAMYDRALGAAASAVLIGTALAVFTASFWLWLIGVTA